MVVVVSIIIILYPCRPVIWIRRRLTRDLRLVGLQTTKVVGFIVLGSDQGLGFTHGVAVSLLNENNNMPFFAFLRKRSGRRRK